MTMTLGTDGTAQAAVVAAGAALLLWLTSVVFVRLRIRDIRFRESNLDPAMRTLDDTGLACKWTLLTVFLGPLGALSGWVLVRRRRKRINRFPALQLDKATAPGQPALPATFEPEAAVPTFVAAV